jgi:hypothetical protein
MARSSSRSRRRSGGRFYEAVRVAPVDALSGRRLLRRRGPAHLATVPEADFRGRPRIYFWVDDVPRPRAPGIARARVRSGPRSSSATPPRPLAGLRHRSDGNQIGLMREAPKGLERADGAAGRCHVVGVLSGSCHRAGPGRLQRTAGPEHRRPSSDGDTPMDDTPASRSSGPGRTMRGSAPSARQPRPSSPWASSPSGQPRHRPGRSPRTMRSTVSGGEARLRRLR